MFCIIVVQEVYCYKKMRNNKMMYDSLLSILSKKYARNSIVQEDINFIKKYLTKENTLLMLQEIVNSYSLLKKIANRSYINTLGFEKIVLMDLSEDILPGEQKSQLQLHVFNCEKNKNILDNTLPNISSIYEHSFDFIVYNLSGYSESQQFISTPLSDTQQLLLKKLQKMISVFTKEQLVFFNEQLEIIEAIALSTLGSEQLFNMSIADKYNLKKLESMTGLTMKQLFEIKCIRHEILSNNYMYLSPYNVLPFDTSSYYFHPYHLPHRLYYNNSVLNCAILMTTPVETNNKTKVLQRPTYMQQHENYDEQINFDSKFLKEALTNYINYLS